MEMNHYENAALLSRLFYLKDKQASMQLAHTNFFESFEAPDDMKAAGFPLPAKIEAYSSFLSQHRRFLLLGAPREWVFIKLQQDGASMAFIGDYAGKMPYPDTLLYLVTMPTQD